MFCVRCGREGSTYESLCVECFLKNNRFTSVPDHVDLFRCAYCEEYLIEGKWRKFASLPEAIRDAVKRSIETKRGADLAQVKMKIEEADVKNFHVHVLSTVEYSDLKLEEEAKTTVRLKGTVCPRCSKMVGNYYESIIQVRGRERKLTEKQKQHLLGEITSRVEEAQNDNREMFISKLQEVPGGLDAYLSSISLGKSIAKTLAEKLGAEVKESSTLVTQKEGRDVYRVTYLVRLPAYMRGEVVLHKAKPHLVMAITSTSTKLLDLKTHEPVNVGNMELHEVKVIGKIEDIHEAVVLTDSKREVQIMHPRTFATVEVRKPQHFEVSGETVRVFVHEEDVYLVP